ncbi:hypothetical protein KXS07_35770 [Inquilinus limosus]|uniref:hypothetical protein n=1 Tax=Inquilinus limosus TaxID=171674 RepID=UPI003F13F0E2
MKSISTLAVFLLVVTFANATSRAAEISNPPRAVVLDEVQVFPVDGSIVEGRFSLQGRIYHFFARRALLQSHWLIHGDEVHSPMPISASGSPGSLALVPPR